MPRRCSDGCVTRSTGRWRFRRCGHSSTSARGCIRNHASTTHFAMTMAGHATTVRRGRMHGYILSDGGAVEISDEELNSRVAAILNGFMERFTRNVEERNRSRLFRLEWALSAVSSRGSMIDTDADVIERAFGPVFAAIEAAERDISAYEAAQAQAGRKVPWHNPPRPGLMLIRGILENVAPGGVAPSVSNRRAIVMIADRTGDVPPLEYRLSHLDFLIAMLFTAGAPSQMARDYLVELGYPPMTEKALNTRWHRLQDDGVVARQKRKPGRKKKNGNGCGGG
jgi:hypothetical protein